MIIVYPKYFVMPVIMDDEFELNYLDKNRRDDNVVNEENKEKGEFDTIDNEFVNQEVG